MHLKTGVPCTDALLSSVVGERFKAMKRISIAVVLVLIVSLTLVFHSSLRVSARVADSDATSSGTPYSAEWRLTGPTGGDVRGLVIDPNDPDRFYFGTLDGQIYTSTDGARTWRMLVNLNRPGLFVDHIIVDPRNSKVLYAATHCHTDPGGSLTSTDGGLTSRDTPDLKKSA